MRARRKVLEGMPENIWNPEREMIGWESGKRPDLLPENEDDEMDNVLRTCGPLRSLGNSGGGGGAI